jgi:hypothetical protein
MKTMLNRINQFAITIIAFACLLGTTVAQSGDAMELHARFDIAPGQNWATVRIEAADWHLGSLQGTQATLAQLKALMAGSHLLAVGGRCAGWVEGQTSYPCGFAIEVLKLDSELLMAGPLQAPWSVKDVNLYTARRRIDFNLICNARRLPCPHCNAPDQVVHDRLFLC